jgi:hypothetical protein
MTTEELNCWERCSLLGWRKTLFRAWLTKVRQMQTQREMVSKEYEEQNSPVKPEEARSQK